MDKIILKTKTMAKSTIDHLNGISAENMAEWLKEAFVAYAISAGNNGRVQLGVNGNGLFVVKHRPSNAPDNTYFFKSMQEAIDKYKELHC